MIRQSTQSGYSQELLSQTQTDLLEMLLADEDQYVWDPTDPASEAYLMELENEFALFDGWSEAEIKESSHKLLEQFDQCWQNDDTTEAIEASLYQQFTSVPKYWLEAIATKAKKVFADNLSVADQLVQCVSSLLPEWGEDDLQVLARPLAYAMRGKTASEAVESTLATVHTEEWDELSDIERARLTLAIANFALNQVKESNC